MPARYILTGRPLCGKTSLAAWLCRRLPQPVLGVRTLCTGRCAAGPLFSLQNLATGALAPISCEADGAVRAVPETFATFGVQALRAARESGAPTVLVDEIGRFERDCAPYLAEVQALLDGPAAVVAVVKKEDLPHLNALRARSEAVQLDLDAEPPEAIRARLAPALPAPLHASAPVRLYRAGKCFGPGPLQLLELVARTGSLRTAAAAMGMAYSKAWGMLNELESQWGFAMVARRPGGAGGGGSLLTEPAWDLIRRYRALQWACDRAAQDAFAQQFGGMR